MKTDAAKTIYLKNYQASPYFIDKTQLRFELDLLDSDSNDDKESYCRVYSKLTMRRNLEVNLSGKLPLRLHGQYFSLNRIALDGNELSATEYQQDEESLTLSELPESFTLEIETQLQPQNNTALEGLYQSSGNYCTQCEAEGFRRITYYLDQPDILSVFTTTIIADQAKYPVLLSNGNPIESGELEDGKHFVTWEDPFKKPSYLFALVAGELSKIEDHYTTKSGREVLLNIFVEHQNADKCEHAMQSLKKSMAWDEQVFGLEYDLDIYMIVAVEDFNMGAMENKGLNVFNSKYVLARADTATDKDYEGIEGVIGHEYFHNWTGNRVTCRDWFQLSLKEGLTVFRDQEFTSDMHSRTVKRIEDVKILRSYQFAEDASPMAHPIRPAQYMEINNFYTVTVYNKGAEVIRMIHTILGKEKFRQGMDLYFQRHDGQAVTTDDFVAAMNDASGIDLGLFKNWYSQAGTPVVSVTSNYDKNQKVVHITLLQNCPDSPVSKNNQPFHIPLVMGLYNRSGKEILSTTLELKTKSAIFSFSNMEDEPIISILRGFSAPIIIEMEQSQDDLVFLMEYDSDPFNRWEAGQKLFTQLIFQQLTQLQQGNDIDWNTSLFKKFIKAFEQVLKDDKLDNALKALAITLPDFSYLLDQLEVADVDNLYSARKSLKKTIAKHLIGLFQESYDSGKTEGDYQFNADDAGKRSLSKACLSYIAAQEDLSSMQLCYQAFQQSNNMTDSMGALAILAQYDTQVTEQAIEEFEQRWHNEPLVLDKWFAVQATSPELGNLKTIKKLMQHPAFEIKNPNRVRSLVLAFAAQNHINFHNKDGSGYEFIADMVIKLDQLNPQVASRMVKLFSRWQRYDQERQALMKQQLERIMAQDNLSGDVYEIASKSLSVDS